MDGNDLAPVRFEDRLLELRLKAVPLGSVSRAEYDALIVAADFDDAAFERFRAELIAAGVSLPEDDVDDDAPMPPGKSGLEPGRRRDLLDLYLDEIGRIRLLTHGELLEKAARSRAGDATARKQLILANLRLVVHVARNYQNRGLPLLDLIEEGNLGLIHAVDRFEPERGLRFSTYAVLWIRQSVLRGLAEQSRAVRIPVQMFQQAHRFVRAERVLRSRLGREPRLEDLAAELQISLARVERLQTLVSGFRTLDEGGGVDVFEDMSAEAVGQGPPSVERLVELQLEHEKIDRLLRTLSQREEQMIRIRYGFHDGIARTLQETGEHFGITRERVRQIEARALEKLRRAIRLADGELSEQETIH